MRKSAVFPVRDSNILKKKLVYWTGNFSSALLIDRNGFSVGDALRDCLVACGELDSCEASSSDNFSSLKSFIEEKGDWLFGYFSYDLKNELEPRVFKLNDPRLDPVGFPLLHFFRPKHIFEIKEGLFSISSVDDPHFIFKEIDAVEVNEVPLKNFGVISSGFTREEYIQSVIKLKEHILNGDVYEVNLCQEFFIEHFSFDPFQTFNRLNAINPAPYSCFLKHDDRFLLCASPERFLKKEGSKIMSQPMKGTISRHGNTTALDEALKQKLQNDPKEKAENVMIVDLVRNDLSRSAIPGTVRVEELFGIYSYTNVHQMVSTISAELRPDIHFIDALKHAFPIGSMTGAPKIMAMQLIDRYEKTRRGLFSGSVGFITPEGDFDFNVVIRSLLYNARSKYLSFQAGAAITIDSVPEKEYEECMVKVKSIMHALNLHLTVSAVIN